METRKGSWTKVGTVAAVCCCSLGLLYGYFDKRPIQFDCSSSCAHFHWHDGQRIGVFKIHFDLPDRSQPITVLHSDSQGFVNYTEQRNYIIQRQWRKTDAENAENAAERKTKEEYLRNVRAIEEPRQKKAVEEKKKYPWGYLKYPWRNN